MKSKQSKVKTSSVEPVEGPPTWSVGAVAFWISFQSPFFANTQNENKNRLYNNNLHNNNSSSSLTKDFDSLLRGYRLFSVRVSLLLLWRWWCFAFAASQSRAVNTKQKQNFIFSFLFNAKFDFRSSSSDSYLQSARLDIWAFPLNKKHAF